MPSHGLKTGDVGAVVQVYSEDAVEVEFGTVSGRTQALVTLATASIGFCRGQRRPVIFR
jgi:hypothetical protein